MERPDVQAQPSSAVASALHAACSVPSAPRRSLGFDTGVLAQEASPLGAQLMRLIGQVGLTEVAYRVAHQPENLQRLSELEGRSGLHPCDRTRVGFMQAFVASAKARQAALKQSWTPELAAIADDRLVESAERMRAFAANYGVEAGDRLPPPPGSEVASKQEELRSAATQLLATHEALVAAKTPGERKARLTELMALRGELALEHPILEGFLPGRNLDLLVSLTKFSAPVTLRRVLAERVQNAEALRAELATNPETVWQMAPVVEALIAAEGLDAKDPDVVLARDLVAAEADAAETTRILISVLSLGLVGVGLAVSGPAGWAVAGAGVAADAADAAVFAQQYGLHAAAARIDVDPSRALTDQTMSRDALVFEGLILGMSATGFAVGDLTRLWQAAESAPGAHFFAAVARRHDEATGLATYAVFEQHGLLGDLHRLTREAAELVADRPGRLAALASDNSRALFGVEGEVGAELLEARMLRLEALDASARRRVSPAELDGLLDFSPRALRGVDSAAVEPMLALRSELGPKRASELVDALGRENLSTVTAQVDLHRVAVAGRGRVVVDGVLSLVGRELAGLAQGGRLEALVERARKLHGTKTPKAVNLRGLRQMEKMAESLRAGGEINKKALSALTGHLGVDPVRLRYRLEGMAGKLEPLSEDLAAIARAHPGLEDALRTVDRLGLAEAARAQVTVSLRRAIATGRFDLGNLSDHLFEAAKAGPGKLDAAVGELQHGLRALDKGDVAEGSRIWLGLGPGQTVDLGLGRTVSLPAATRASLQDIDVLYVRSDGVLQAVEVKRQPSTLRQKLETEDKYLDKFETWRKAAPPGERAVAMAFSQEGEGLDVTLSNLEITARALLEKAGIAIREASW